MKRCSWCEGDELYIRYHDEEWGVLVFDDRKQFEFLVFLKKSRKTYTFTIFVHLCLFLFYHF